MKKGYFAIIVGAIIFWGCQPKPNAADLVRHMVVTTNSYNDYWYDYPTTVTSLVRDKMDSLGYAKVNFNQSPDLKIYIVIVENYNVYQSYQYSPYGYYGYGGYYPTVSVSDQADLYINI